MGNEILTKIGEKAEWAKLDESDRVFKVILTKDETITAFTSKKRYYTASKTKDEISAALHSGKNVILYAPYINENGHDVYGIYHFIGFDNGDIGFINVIISGEAILADAKSPIVGYDVIVCTDYEWVGSYTSTLSTTEVTT